MRVDSASFGGFMKSTGRVVSEELDERALARDLSKLVEESELSLPKIASLMGVFSATLSMWIAGTAKPSGANLLLIKRFLESAISLRPL